MNEIADSAPDAMPHTGLAPVVGPNTVLLVLGSFPSAASLRARQYYAHPRNQFWPLMAALWPRYPQPGAHDYAGRCAWLLDRGLGLWDVYAACERSGSLDAAIRHGQRNDFSRIAAQCPRLAAIAHNGGESARHAAAVQSALAQLGREQPTMASYRLPSTSPAHAAWSFERKCAAWGAVVAALGLI
ncbi:MAG: DNA-deoxyinosine glycosylase [Simplicispira sp.]|nr:DNA-deoxyinosine glycosylase [Simplicispira sp.]